MSRNLLSEISSLKVYSSIGTFANGDTMSIDVYKDGSSVPETLTTGTLTQIGTTGIYFWPFSDLASSPTALTEYKWVMSDATTKTESGVERFGGWVELLTTALPATDICRITTSLFEVDGICSIEANVLSDQTSNANHIELKTQYHDGSRYFKLGKYAPNYDRANDLVYWDFPQGSTVDVNLSSFGVTHTNAEIPAVSTVDLKVWLDSL
jgi:hypothetical protein